MAAQIDRLRNRAEPSAVFYQLLAGGRGTAGDSSCAVSGESPIRRKGVPVKINPLVTLRQNYSTAKL